VRDLLRVEIADGRCAVVRHSTKHDGDLSPSTVGAAELVARRAELVAVGPWHVTRQVHGSSVIEVADHPPSAERPTADALVTTRSSQVLAVHAGDCVPVGLAHPAGAVAAVHAGWKGLEADVIGEAVRALRTAAGPDGEIVAAIGPHIRAGHYEFGGEDLERLMDRFGPEVAARTENGRPALDLSAATRRALTEVGVTVGNESSDCTAAQADDYWSHRARGERGRIALTAWLEPA
jgi:YfiH family protein